MSWIDEETRSLEDARRRAAVLLDSARDDLGRPFGRPPRSGFWLLLIAAAALGFKAAVAGRSRGTTHRADRPFHLPPKRRVGA